MWLHCSKHAAETASIGLLASNELIVWTYYREQEGVMKRKMPAAAAVQQLSVVATVSQRHHAVMAVLHTSCWSSCHTCLSPSVRHSLSVYRWTATLRGRANNGV